MDEPTNDLDVETLELLEDLLGEYDGTLLLVSHDRQFIDNIVTHTLVLEGHGQVGEYVGGYDDWLRQRTATATSTRSKKKSLSRTPAKKSIQKLSYKEQRELDALPGDIESLETKTAELQTHMSQASFYEQDRDTIATATTELKAAQDQLKHLYQRWSELDK